MTTLTKAEEKIMKILWGIEKGFIKDIIDEYPNPKPPYNSVSTIVRVLVQKEIVGFTAYGNSHQYHPLISKEDYSKGQMSRLVSDYYNNSLSKVLSFFSESKQLDEKELDEAMRMLEELKAKKNG
ncbi:MULTISPECIES: BlaI/MecI/CopY family transcriptional regulator [Reichenbachiella]|uniref:Predicted transcriptional regulator n=1 Tax=Reichenbachiella agariperforans TaxID=156994 RepID=A0A1M6N759_REIAG|nr:MULTISPECIES: BlaI/MecI/CopY family transcriptional regulator [Reichenbachiella]MBU2915761.1 BlaI/MecI/CopY family transcriptional regulator [Reichenbachiella agariperforans]RJE71974.1 transcriptional regulator [Reichenbachiella sp. MSK19-1]SHJ91575.1 Predicted transcriptional regulator [Reichenbachiella agariperforans]